MDQLVDIIAQLSGVLAVLFWGILMLCWFAPGFFDFLRDMFGKNQKTLSQLEEKVSQLESELNALRQEVESDEMTSAQTTLIQEQHSQPDQTNQSLANPGLKMHLDKAILYKQQLTDLIQSNANESTQQRLYHLAEQIDQWVETLETLAYRVDSIKQNDLIQQDLEIVPKSIERLAEQIERENNADVKAALERTLTNRKTQLGALERLQQLVHQAEIQMENTLSSLGTIYSQMLTAQSTNQVADYQHLSTEAEEEQRILQDHLEALTEVKLQGR